MLWFFTKWQFSMNKSCISWIESYATIICTLWILYLSDWSNRMRAIQIQCVSCENAQYVLNNSDAIKTHSPELFQVATIRLKLKKVIIICLQRHTRYPKTISDSCRWHIKIQPAKSSSGRIIFFITQKVRKEWTYNCITRETHCYALPGLIGCFFCCVKQQLPEYVLWWRICVHENVNIISSIEYRNLYFKNSKLSSSWCLEFRTRQLESALLVSI